MTFNIKEHKDKLLFLPLGGSREIGMNLNLYHYKGKWIMADLGAGFADDYYPGVDVIVPDITFIQEQILPDLLGIILTHAHEDHLGAIPYLWQQLKLPIYTTPFTASFLKLKLEETDFAKQIKIKEVAQGSTLKLDPFTIEMIPLTHSAPEMQALVIRTELGNILHTGDWKFDHNPLICEANDEELLRKIGNEGILALVGDSTNVFNEQPSGSEGDLRESLTSLISDCKKMVVVTTFASNVARLETIITAAESAGRKVFIAGRSLFRILEASRNSGYLKDIPPMLEPHQLAETARDKTLVIATGCQGEPFAAVTKMANKSHNFVKLGKDDSIIFSSKIIPGNEKKIFRLFNAFAKMGVEVYTEQDHFVHVSGHPSKAELKKMYELVRPKIAVPVHGELIHLHEHVRFAKEVGVPEAVQVENGVVTKLAPGKAEIIGEVESGYIAVDGLSLIPTSSPIIRMRRKLASDGIIIVTLLMDSSLKLLHPPTVSGPGILDRETDEDIKQLISKEIALALKDHRSALPKKGNSNRKKSQPRTALIDNITRQAIRRVTNNELGKNPVIEINMEILD